MTSISDRSWDYPGAELVSARARAHILLSVQKRLCVFTTNSDRNLAPMASAYQTMYAQLMRQLSHDISTGAISAGGPMMPALSSGGSMIPGKGNESSAQEYFSSSPFHPSNLSSGVVPGFLKGQHGPFEAGFASGFHENENPPPTTSTMPTPMSSPYFGKGAKPSQFKGALPPPFGKGTFPLPAAPPPPSTPPPSYICTICESEFPNQNALSLHRFQAHGHRHIAVHGAESSYVSVGGFGSHKGKGLKGSKGLVYKSCNVCGYNGNLLRFAWCNRCHSPLPTSPTGIASAPGHLTGKSGISGVLPAKPYPPSAPLATVYSPETAIPMTGVVDDKTDGDVEITYPSFTSGSASVHPDVNPKSIYPPQLRRYHARQPGTVDQDRRCG